MHTTLATMSGALKSDLPAAPPDLRSTDKTVVDIPNGDLWHRLSLLPSILRKRFMRPWFRWRFAEFGPGSAIERGCYVVNPRSIVIGSKVQVQRYANLEALGPRDGKIRLRIGEGSVIRPYVRIGAVESVTIGRECIIAPYTLITDHDHDTTDPTQPVAVHRRVVVSPTVLEDGVFVAERVAILHGVRIGTGSVIGTNSVVTRHIPPYSIAVGMPARVIKTWDPATRRWSRVNG